MQDSPSLHSAAPTPSILHRPSAWPLIVGASAVLVGIALLYWSRTDREFAGPVLGASVAFAVLLAGLWAFEDLRVKRRASRAERSSAGARIGVQTVSFSIAPAQFAAAQSPKGVLAAIQRLDDEFYGLEGFEDIRVVVGPPGEEPVPVVVETTWAGRGAESDSARRRLQTVLEAHAAELEGGAEQVDVRDLEVFSNSADKGFHLSIAALSGVVGTFLVGGILLGMASNVGVRHTTTTAAPDEGAPVEPAGPLKVSALDFRFNPTTITAKAGEEFTFTLNNNGKAPHNIAFLDRKGGTTLADGAKGDIVAPGGSLTMTFTAPAAGTYYFQCDLHPDQMTGKFVVE